MAKSKKQLVEELYIDPNGYSNFITRDNLIDPLKWTSGDSIFRGDGKLAEIYKILRFSSTLDMSKRSRNWNLNNEEINRIQEDHRKLSFKKNSGNYVEYIKIYGRLNCYKDEGIRNDIKKEILKRSCSNCGTERNIQCDYKNDLKNNERVLCQKTQHIVDFQALCGHCHSLKRSILEKTKLNKKRFSAKNLGYNIDFTKGGGIFNENDIDWYIGTYWGDCLDFKNKLSLK